MVGMRPTRRLGSSSTTSYSTTFDPEMDRTMHQSTTFWMVGGGDTPTISNSSSSASPPTRSPERVQHFHRPPGPNDNNNINNINNSSDDNDSHRATTTTTATTAETAVAAGTSLEEDGSTSVRRHRRSSSSSSSVVPPPPPPPPPPPLLSNGPPTVPVVSQRTTPTTTNTITTSNNTTLPPPPYSTTEDLMSLLHQLRNNNNNNSTTTTTHPPPNTTNTNPPPPRSFSIVRRIELHRKRLPAAYLRALFAILTSTSVVVPPTTPAGASCAVTVLHLTQSGVTDALVPSLTEFLRVNRTVTDLDLTRNGITSNGCAQLARAFVGSVGGTETATDATKTSNSPTVQSIFTSANTTLRRLSLEGNPLTTRVKDNGTECEDCSGMQALCQALATSGVQNLRLNKMGLHGESVAAIAALLQSGGAPLVKLDVSSCDLGDEGASLLAKALCMKRITIHTPLAPNETATILDASPEVTTASIRCSTNKAVHSTPSSLQWLCMARNDIGDESVQEFATALQHNTSLLKLDLQYNPSITDTGGRALAHCLRHFNHTFQKVKLRHCATVSNEVKEELLQLLLINSHGPDLAERTKVGWQTLLSQEQNYYQKQQQKRCVWKNITRRGKGFSKKNQSDAKESDSFCLSDCVEKRHLESDECSANETLDGIETARSNRDGHWKDGDGNCWDDSSVSSSVDNSVQDHIVEVTTVLVKDASAKKATSSAHTSIGTPIDIFDVCVICYDELLCSELCDNNNCTSSMCVLLPCQHSNCCRVCAAKLQHCHMCRESIVKVFPLGIEYQNNLINGKQRNCRMITCGVLREGLFSYYHTRVCSVHMPGSLSLF